MSPNWCDLCASEIFLSMDAKKLTIVYTFSSMYICIGKYISTCISNLDYKSEYICK